MAETSGATCIACSEPIAQNAKVCSLCQQYQNRWLNRFRYWGNLGGIVTVGFAAISFLITTWDELSRTVLREDNISLLHFESLADSHSVNILNDGDGRVWIRDLQVSIGTRQNKSVRIARMANPDEVVSYDQEIPLKGTWELSEVDKQTKNAITEGMPLPEECSRLSFLDPNNSRLKIAKVRHELNTGIPASVQVNVISVGTSEELSFTFDVFALVWTKVNCGVSEEEADTETRA